ncbi:hypothetical protein ACQPZF_18530 [Actinosynnema sp. CS-041913]|uniref:hypothetical protein n=1 Tax=Actinosynnema sp. CS-041913 TaxID=3239917 RepID=UPI003D8F209F
MAALIGGVYPLGVRWTRALPMVLATWLVLVWLAPSFGWCAIPLFFQCLRQLRPRHSVPIAGVLTLAVVLGQIRAQAHPPQSPVSIPSGRPGTSGWSQIGRQSASSW